MVETRKVGAVAESSGVTVRTLHHWDDIGLLQPSHRGVGGHREYSDDVLVRLYLILVLRDLGLPLDSIRTCLEGGLDVHRVLRDQLAHLDAVARSLARLRVKVTALLDTAGDQARLANADELLQLLRDSRHGAQDFLEGYLSEEQRGTLAAHAAEVGSALPYFLEVEWPQLYRQAETLRIQGADPSDERVQKIVARLDELSGLFGGTEGGTGGRVRKAWRDNPAVMSGEPEDIAMPWRAVADFVENARRCRSGKDSYP
jgi:MerR family transcriptional regulator, thiopeptide resistance regulator